MVHLKRSQDIHDRPELAPVQQGDRPDCGEPSRQHADQPRPASEGAPAMAAEEDRQCSEIRYLNGRIEYLNGRVEELQRQLWRRTLGIWFALSFSAAAIVSVALAGRQLPLPAKSDDHAATVLATEAAPRPTPMAPEQPAPSREPTQGEPAAAAPPPASAPMASAVAQPLGRLAATGDGAEVEPIASHAAPVGAGGQLEKSPAVGIPREGAAVERLAEPPGIEAAGLKRLENREPAPGELDAGRAGSPGGSQATREAEPKARPRAVEMPPGQAPSATAERPDGGASARAAGGGEQADPPGDVMARMVAAARRAAAAAAEDAAAQGR